MSLGDAMSALTSADVNARSHLTALVGHTARRVLDWMAVGNREDLSRFIAEVRALPRHSEAMNTASEKIRTLAPLEQAAAYVQAFAEIAATYLRTDNLARHLVNFSGRRSEGWRQSLVWARGLARPIRAGDLVSANIYDKSRSAAAALKRLVDLGYFEVAEGSALSVYRLTWLGSQVAAALVQVPASEGESTEKEESAESEVAIAPVPAPTESWIPDDEKMKDLGLDGLSCETANKVLRLDHSRRPLPQAA